LTAGKHKNSTGRDSDVSIGVDLSETKFQCGHENQDTSVTAELGGKTSGRLLGAELVTGCAARGRSPRTEQRGQATDEQARRSALGEIVCRALTKTHEKNQDLTGEARRGHESKHEKNGALVTAKIETERW
jgi:hypothetical protein